MLLNICINTLCIVIQSKIHYINSHSFSVIVLKLSGKKLNIVLVLWFIANQYLLNQTIKVADLIENIQIRKRI